MYFMKNNFTYNEIKSILKEAKIEDAGFETDVLISRFCGISMSQLPLVRGEIFTSDELSEAIEKRVQRYPLQYLVGEWDFYRESYFVSPDCLIPRPETELLVELAVSLLPRGASFLDLCTGSGCIAVSTLCARKDCRATAVDAFDGTLEIARKNAERNGVEKSVDFIKCDLLEKDAPKKVCGGKKIAAVLSNPPYIKTCDLAALEPELFFEPRVALDGGDDGLIFYRKIIADFAPCLDDGGFMLFEAGSDTARGVAEIGAKNGFCTEVIPDLSGLDRMILLKK
jgi:release factor glutamine methyltransferase